MKDLRLKLLQTGSWKLWSLEQSPYGLLLTGGSRECRQWTGENSTLKISYGKKTFIYEPRASSDDDILFRTETARTGTRTGWWRISFIAAHDCGAIVWWCCTIVRCNCIAATLRPHILTVHDRYRLPRAGIEFHILQPADRSFIAAKCDVVD